MTDWDILKQIEKDLEGFEEAKREAKEMYKGVKNKDFELKVPKREFNWKDKKPPFLKVHVPKEERENVTTEVISNLLDRVDQLEYRLNKSFKFFETLEEIGLVRKVDGALVLTPRGEQLAMLLEFGEIEDIRE